MRSRVHFESGGAMEPRTVMLEALSGDNTQATMRTLQAMAQLIRGEIKPDGCGFRSETVRAAAIKATKGASDEAETIQRWFEFCRDRISYRRDTYDTERLQDACTTLAYGSGDCDDKVILLCSGLLALGFYPRFVAQNNGVEFSHVYAEVLDEATDQYVALDATADGTGNRPRFEIGQRNPAQHELLFDIFSEAEVMAGSNGLGAFNWGDWETSRELYQNDYYQSGIPYDPNIDLYDLAARGIDVAGAALSRSPYYSPDDPRYRANNQNIYQFPQPLPQGGNVAAASLNSGGISASIPFWAWALGGVVLAAFLFGKGRR